MGLFQVTRSFSLPIYRSSMVLKYSPPFRISSLVWISLLITKVTDFCPTTAQDLSRRPGKRWFLGLSSQRPPLWWNWTSLSQGPRLLPSCRSSSLSQIPTHRLSLDLLLMPPLPQLLSPPDLPLQPEFHLQPPLIQSKLSSSQWFHPGWDSKQHTHQGELHTYSASWHPSQALDLIFTHPRPNSSPPLPKSFPLSWRQYFRRGWYSPASHLRMKTLLTCATPSSPVGRNQ